MLCRVSWQKVMEGSPGQMWVHSKGGEVLIDWTRTRSAAWSMAPRFVAGTGKRWGYFK